MPVKGVFTDILCSCLQACLSTGVLKKHFFFSLLKKVVVLTLPIFIILHKTSQVERLTKITGTIPPRKCFSEVKKSINVSGCLVWSTGSRMKKKHKELESLVRYSVSCQKMAAT